MKRTLLILILTFLFGITYSQKKGNAPKVEKIQNAIKLHKELQIEDAESGYTVIPTSSEGLMIAYMPEEKAKNGMRNFVFQKYDIDFNEKFSSKISIDKKYSLKSYTLENDYIYALFYSNPRNLPVGHPDMIKDYLIAKVSIKEKDVKIYAGLPERTIYFQKMLVNNGVVSISGKYGPSYSTLYTVGSLSIFCCYIPLLFINYKYTPVIINIDMNPKSSQKKEYVMENYLKGKVEFVDMDINDSTGDIDFVVNHDYKKSNASYLRSLKSKKLTNDILIKKPKEIQISNSKINALDDENKYIMGTYTKYGQKRSVSQGIYVTLMDGNKQKYFKTIPWNKFKNFRVATTNTERALLKRNEKKGKATEILMRVIFHDVLVKEDETVFFGETYYPRFEQHVEYSVGADGRTTRRTVTVFIGYQYAGALAFALDEKGDLVWDNGFDISGPLTFFLEEKFKFYEIGNDEYSVVYNQGIKLRVQTLNKLNDQTIIKEVDMSINSNGNKVKYYDSDGGEVNYWYDDYYLATGQQKLKNKKAKGSARNKNVFYMNKVELLLNGE